MNYRKSSRYWYYTVKVLWEPFLASIDNVIVWACVSICLCMYLVKKNWEKKCLICIYMCNRIHRDNHLDLLKPLAMLAAWMCHVDWSTTLFQTYFPSYSMDYREMVPRGWILMTLALTWLAPAAILKCSLLLWHSSTFTGQIGTKLGTDIQCPTDCSDSLTFHLATISVFKGNVSKCLMLISA